MNTLKFSILFFVFLLCIYGCSRDYNDVMEPPIASPDPAEIESSFHMNILPILTDRCALAGCHVADGPDGLDLRTYDSFKAGTNHGPIFIPGNAEESEVIKEIKSGNMPLGGPPLTSDQIQLFVDWINQQPLQEGVEYDHHDHHDHDGDHDDDASDHDDDYNDHGDD